MTGVKALIAANVVVGAIAFLDIESAASVADILWKPTVPISEDLPEPRAIPDLSLAFWNRVWSDQPENERKLGDIKYFLVHYTINEGTKYLVKMPSRFNNHYMDSLQRPVCRNGRD